MHSRDTTRYFKFQIPERDDPIDITAALNNALDIIDSRIGGITQTGWVSNTTFSAVGYTSSTRNSKIRKFNKQQFGNIHVLISTVTNVSGGIQFVPGLMGGYTTSGEPDYQDAGFSSTGPFEIVGMAVAYDVSANQYHGLRVMTSSTDSGRIRLETATGASTSSTVPFTWASGDFLSVWFTTQAFGD